MVKDQQDQVNKEEKVTAAGDAAPVEAEKEAEKRTAEEPKEVYNCKLLNKNLN